MKKCRAMMSISIVFAVGGLLQSCVRPPNIVVTGQKTALENQAAGEFHSRDNELGQAGMKPRGETIPREQLLSPDQRGGDTHGQLAELYAKTQDDANWVDQSLTAQCIGEAATGLLQPTPASCKKKINTTEMTRIVGRTNLHRRQLWRLIHRQRPNVNESTIQSEWRRIHIQRVVCGALIENNNGVWRPKKC